MRSLSLLFVLACTLFSTFTAAQNLSTAAGARRNIMFTDLMNGMPIVRPQAGIEGDPFLNPIWHLTTITLYELDGPIEGYYTQYNIHFDELDFKTQSGVKALEGSKVKSFTFKDTTSSVFVNAKEYALDGTPLLGFFEILVDGPSPLLKKYYVVIKNPDYHPALGTGSRNTRVTKHSDLYFAKGQEVFEVKGKKKLLAAFGDKATDMDKFMKDKSLYPNDQVSLTAIFTHYNALLKQVP